MFYKSNFNLAQKLMALSLLTIFLSLGTAIPVASQDLGNGFFDHGVACSLSTDRGVVIPMVKLLL